MNFLYRNCKSPLQRGVYLGLVSPQRTFTRPFILLSVHCDKSKEPPKSTEPSKPKKLDLVDTSKSKEPEMFKDTSKSVKTEIIETPKSVEQSKSDGTPKPKGSDGDKKTPVGKDQPKQVIVPTGPPKIELRIVPARYPRISYDERNMKLGRPLSPHLSIYKKQLTSVMSILLRGSGILLGIGIWIIGLSSLCCDVDINALATKIEKCECSKSILTALKFALMVPFSYHVVAGTRHLIWYLNFFLSKSEIYATGYAAILLTFILALVLTNIDQNMKEEDVFNVEYDGQIEMKVQNMAMEPSTRSAESDI